jgi:hypothetical protein
MFMTIVGDDGDVLLTAPVQFVKMYRVPVVPSTVVGVTVTYVE